MYVLVFYLIYLIFLNLIVKVLSFKNGARVLIIIGIMKCG